MAHKSARAMLDVRCAAAGLSLMTLAASCGSECICPPPTATIVELKSGERLTGIWPASLAIDRDRSYVLGFSSGDSSALWTLRIPLTREQSLSGAVTVPVSAAAGLGEATLRDGNGISATSGSVTVVFGKGSIRGTADVQPDALAGQFRGQFGLSCSVPRSSLANLAPPSTSGGDVEPEVEDAALTTETCAPFKALRP
jgi:hypothetical protein